MPPRRTRLAILCCAAIAVVAILAARRPVRVGDGSEYYAMFVAWRDTGRPFLTDAGWRAYDAVRASGEITGLVETERLREGFASLGGGADVHHFWFYSALAAVIARLFGIGSANTPFLVLAAALLAALLVVANRAFGTRGAIAALLLLFLSPAVWFVDKVHTEHFTFCLTTIAVIEFARRRHATSALALAVASTQNPSFAAVAVLVAAIGALTVPRARWRRRSAALYAAALVFAAIHPLYYGLRYGALSPQLYTGGARLFASWRYAWVFLFDPDVGLFPSWWLGIVLLVVAGVAAKRQARWTALVVGWVGINLAAQSSTLNLNAGGTFGVSRYATWYLALFFPPMLACVRRVSLRPRLAVAIGALAAVHAFVFFRPSLDESGYGSPTPISYAIQRWAPWAYDPPVEIFAERYGGVGESYPVLATAVAIAGPDCRKVLVLRSGAGRVLPASCNLAVADLVSAHALAGGPFHFVRLPANDPRSPARLAGHPRAPAAH